METFEALYQAAKEAQAACDAHWAALRVANYDYGESFKAGTQPLDGEWVANYRRLNEERIRAEQRVLDFVPDR